MLEKYTLRKAKKSEFEQHLEATLDLRSDQDQFTKIDLFNENKMKNNGLTQRQMRKT